MFDRSPSNVDPILTCTTSVQHICWTNECPMHVQQMYPNVWCMSDVGKLAKQKVLVFLRIEVIF